MYGLNPMKSPNGISMVQVQEKHLVEETPLYRYDLHIPVILGVEGDALNERINSDINRDLNKYLQELKLTANGYIIPTTPYYLESNYEIYNHDDAILSFCILYTNYFGGAHSMTYKKCYNYDLRTGERLLFKDLVKDQSMKMAINEEIKRQIDRRNKALGYEAINAFKGIGDRQKFYIRDGLLVLYFDLYQIAPYVAGIIEFTMPRVLYNGKQ